MKASAGPPRSFSIWASRSHGASCMYPAPANVPIHSELASGQEGFVPHNISARMHASNAPSVPALPRSHVKVSAPFSWNAAGDVTLSSAAGLNPGFIAAFFRAGWLSYIAVIVAANSLLISGGVDMRTPTKAVRMHLNTRQYASNADHHHCVDALFWTTP